MFEKTDPIINTFYTQHNDLRALFETTLQDLEPIQSSLVEGTLLDQKQMEIQHLEQIERGLMEHIRFEERELFDIIQDIATQEQLETIAQAHQSANTFEENTQDEFWL